MPCGRVTVEALQLDRAGVVNLRRFLTNAGLIRYWGKLRTACTTRSPRFGPQLKQPQPVLELLAATDS